MGVERGAVELHTHTDTHACLWVASREHLACNLKAVFGVLFPPLHDTGHKTAMLQNDILQVMSKPPLCTTQITFPGETRNICWCASVPPPVPNPKGSCGACLLPSSSPCSHTALSSGDGCRSWNLICAWCWSSRCRVKWSFPPPPRTFPWGSEFGSSWALCKLMDAKGMLSTVGVG